VLQGYLGIGDEACNGGLVGRSWGGGTEVGGFPRFGKAVGYSYPLFGNFADLGGDGDAVWPNQCEVAVTITQLEVGMNLGAEERTVVLAGEVKEFVAIVRNGLARNAPLGQIFGVIREEPTDEILCRVTAVVNLNPWREVIIFVEWAIDVDNEEFIESESRLDPWGEPRDQEYG
jgi:hypothetical protein